ncbi:hypothetical protein [Pseudoduganella chitinolytica]|uniref:Uncharacterized protein n=1 Tax=Pseudoduganella chitinolytica TaxID=34070 RepID=A0ABY8BEI2_9BURK|nr:hypothetical protein [Pseudoduganella chitinolytica]WEF34321.1 hypothetical protein PX653_05985 [Pseudoduganella chitinolytica]
MINSILKTLVLAGCVALGAHGGASAAPAGAAASVSSLQQGLHQWAVLKGKLVLVNGTYQDVTTYKRSLTFYFESKPGAAWLHVPVIDSPTEQETTWFSISQGEQTVADAAVVARGEGVELVIAETKPGKGAPVAVRWYRLAESDDDNPDGPAYFFKRTSATSYPAKAKLTVEQVLKKEISSRSSK